VIFLLNRERVLLEVLELARLKIASLLNVPAQAVAARMELNAGKVSPVFEVRSDEAQELSEEAVGEAIASVYSRIMEEYAIRLDGLQTTKAQTGTSI
jgi:hypothetical protein